MTDDKLISLKEEFLQKAASIDAILRREEAKKETACAMQKLKKLMEDNKSYAYMCISQKRVNTGPSNQYYINIPDNVTLYSDSKDCIKINYEVFCTYEGASTNQVSISIGALKGSYDVYQYSEINKILEGDNGSIIFLTREEVEERADDALLKYITDSIATLRNKFSSNMITTKKIEVMSEVSASKILSHMKALEGALRSEL